MRTHLRNVIAVVMLVAVIYFVTNYAGQVQQQIGVKGASTSRAQGIAGHIASDVGTQVSSAEKQAMKMNISDFVSSLSRFQRIPRDINDIKNYAQSQVNDMLQSRNKK